MAKRGRPSKKTLQKRKETKQKSELVLLFGIFVLIAFVVIGYLLMK